MAERFQAAHQRAWAPRGGLKGIRKMPKTTGAQPLDLFTCSSMLSVYGSSRSLIRSHALPPTGSHVFLDRVFLVSDTVCTLRASESICQDAADPGRVGEHCQARARRETKSSLCKEKKCIPLGEGTFGQISSKSWLILSQSRLDKCLSDGKQPTA